MYDHVKVLQENIDADALWKDINNFLIVHDFWDKDQISLTSIDGEDDWFCSVGKRENLQHSEHFYKEVNNFFIGSSIEKLVKNHKDFFRWRLMKLNPRSNYSIHSDGLNSDKILNIRLHIPVKTNDQCYLAFFENHNVDNSLGKFYNLKYGYSYLCNTTGYHSALNFSSSTRWHIVGAKYEDSNNWS